MGKGGFFIWLFFVFNFCSFAYCAIVFNITSSTPLSSSQTLNSPRQIYELGFFIPNNNSLNQFIGIWFKEVSPQTVVWVANRAKPITNSSANLTISSDGNLKILDGEGNIFWSTNVSASSNGSIAILTDEGLLVLRDRISGATLWDSSRSLTDTLLPGRFLAYNDSSGETLLATSWKTENDPTFGDFRAGVSRDTPPQAVIWKGSKLHWRSGPWDRSKFIGIPEMDADYESGLTVIDGIQPGTAYLSVSVLRNCTYSTFMVTSIGSLRFSCWLKERGWYTRWEAPVAPCEVYGACGTFGVCERYAPNLTCKCLKGFVPKSVQEWNNGNWTGGCVRRTELSCGRNGNSTTNNATQGGIQDGFLKLSGLRLPDFSEFLKVWDANECGLQCKNNCSCSGYAYVDAIGCLAWTGQLVDMHNLPLGGQDLYLRLANSELGNGENKKKNKVIISLVVIASVAIICAMIYGFIKLRTRKSFITNARNESPRDSSHGFMWKSPIEDKDPLELPLFDFNSILVATNNFDTANKLGQGGYGPVYKGTLPDGKNVAIKRLSTSSGQGINEFKNEVKLISKLQHRNLVKLIGCCIERDEKILMYEFMSNKSLDTYLFDSAKKAELDWTKRFNIITGVARGLLYLHRDSCLRVIHRDLKVSNILLDEKMNPKISDFGLARIFEGTQVLGSTHKVVGTIGYMAPEYLLGGMFSEKSDVFGFGVLTLEIVSGRKASSFQLDEHHLSLLAYAWRCWSKTRGVDMIDEALADSSASEVSRCVNIGLLCVQDHASERPTMASIVSMLSGEKTNLPEPKQPTFTFHNVPTSSSNAQSQSRSTCSVNNMTETVIEPR
ncbi:G-type lectin S-receptor-like serine/threonine-protein kinase At1g61370 [Euphorbia lathyris]|uniref:G-type lectin S-receptor-like serine/threonine-protein kinase At1g61370 n=1 Tax=Euphorbia lathyris TaxID=212925 RepID=UPI00331370B5